jgi:hypothetical protein
MVPAPVKATDRVDDPRLTLWVRAALVAIAAGLTLVFGLARRIDPYDPDGLPRRMETHTQLGLPPCNFYRWTGRPCPACGMTTSFALMAHGDPVNSLRANAVGTLLAVAGAIALPWCLASLAAGRWIGFAVTEGRVLGVLTLVVGLALVRWAAVLALGWWGMTP